MKKRFCAAILLVSSLVLQINCKKYTPIERDHRTCKLKSFYTGVYDYDCFYTEWGAPDRMINRDPKGLPSLYFIYNNNQHLTGLIYGYVRGLDTLFAIYYKYLYTGSRISDDSTFTGGQIANGEPVDFNPDFISSGHYEYDQYGRVIQYNDVQYPYPPQNTIINNKTVLGGDSILMFVNKDYSNKNAAAEYNEFRYPTRFAEYANGLRLGWYQFLQLEIHTADYTCK